MKVFITGANGYIGSAVSQAYRRAGHLVWGLILSEAEAPSLTRNEIFPLVGDLSKPESYRSVAEQCDVLIHCAADYRHDWAASDKQTIASMIAISQASAQPKTVIFTSGSWVYWNTHGRLVDERSPLAPIHIGAHRPGVEQMLLGASGVRGIVIRPANVYGKRESMLHPWLDEAYHGQAVLAPGDGNNHWPTVHVDDLAAGYLLAGTTGPGGQVYNFSDGTHPQVSQLADTIVAVAGDNERVKYLSHEKAHQQMGDTAEAYELDLEIDSRKARDQLGWQPSRHGFVPEANLYFEAWKAWHNDG